MKTSSAAVLLVLALVSVPPGTGLAQGGAGVTEADVDNAAKSVARYCKIVVERMDDLISADWATEDLSNLANVWDALNCHQLFGFDPAPAPQAAGGDDGDRLPRWIVR